MANGKTRGKSGKKNAYGTGKAFAVFQKRPGIGAAKIIKDGGPAMLTFRSGKAMVVQPADGVYCLDVPKGEDAVLEIFGTQYRVRILPAGDADSGSGSITSWQPPLLPKNELKGVQQRLQILGYYTGKVDGVMGAKTERAVLEFQADEGTLKIDGDPGPKTKKALDEFTEKNGKEASGKHYLIRRYLLRFERADFGATKWDCPQIDFRGGGVPVLGFGMETGVVSWLMRYLGISEKPFRLGVALENLDAGAFPVWVGLKSDSSATFTVQSRKLGGASEKIRLLPKAEGRETLELRLGKQDGPVLGEVNLRCASLIQVKVAAHILDVRQAGSMAPLASPSLWTRGEIEAMVAAINAIWIPVGVEFSIARFGQHVVTAGQPGQISDDYVANNLESEALRKNFNQEGFVNMYFSQNLSMVSNDGNGNRQTSNPLGFAFDRPHHGKVLVCIRKDANAAILARVVAHELGHVLQLTPAPYRHADDQGVDTPWRNDIWSRMRLMAKYVGYYRNSFGNQAWQDTTYGTDPGGAMNAGDLITVKDFGSDDSDGEYNIARKAAKNPY